MMTLNNRVLIRNVNSRKHYFVKYKAYSFDESIIQTYNGQFDSLIFVTSYGKKYAISSVDFWSKSKVIQFAGKEQRLIEVKYFNLESMQSTKTVHLDAATHQRLKLKAKQHGVNISYYLNKMVS